MTSTKPESSQSEGKLYHTRMWKSYFLPSATVIVPTTINYILLTLAFRESGHVSSSSAGVHIYPSGQMCFHRGYSMDKKCFTDEILNISLLGQQLFMGYSAVTVKHRTTNINQTII